MTNMKRLLLVGLFALAGMTAKAEAGTYFTTRSTAILVSSGVPFNVTGIMVSSAATPNLNAHFVVLYDTDGYTNGINTSFVACATNFAASKLITPPIIFASSQIIIGTDVQQWTGNKLIIFPGSGITVENGLMVCQVGGTGTAG